MKKIVFALFVLMSFAVSAVAQKTTRKKTKFYYYPSANVYYDVATSQYAYDSSGTWVYVQYMRRINYYQTKEIIKNLLC